MKQDTADFEDLDEAELAATATSLQARGTRFSVCTMHSDHLRLHWKATSLHHGTWCTWQGRTFLQERLPTVLIGAEYTTASHRDSM